MGFGLKPLVDLKLLTPGLKAGVSERQGKPKPGNN